MMLLFGRMSFPAVAENNQTRRPNTRESGDPIEDYYFYKTYVLCILTMNKVLTGALETRPGVFRGL